MSIKIRDFKYLVFNKYPYIIKQFVYLMLYNPLLYLICSLKGIKLKKRIRFYGYTYFYRIKDSSIIIGSECLFRSKEHSNLIGINRKCSVSTIKSGANIEIGNNCGFSGTVIAAAKSITIGTKVRCGANTLITDSDWHMEDPRVSQNESVVIMDNVWLGVNSIVLKGVTIGKNSIIGAGSVVVKNIPENVIAAGNPCHVIKEINHKKD